MSALFWPRALSFLGLLLAFLLIASASVIFESVVPGLINIARNNSGSPKTLRTISPLDRSSCALACSLDPECRAFLHTEPDRCELLSSPWRPPPSQEGQTLMMRRPEHPMTWRFNGSQYIVTKEKGNFDEMKAACAAQGMHLWYPNSQEEMRFVEREILCNLPKEYFWIPGWSGGEVIVYDVWIGVIDRPNGNCLLADGVTKCPVENYHPDEPNGGASECTWYWWNSGFSWDDIPCSHIRFGLCEKEN